MNNDTALQTLRHLALGHQPPFVYLVSRARRSWCAEGRAAHGKGGKERLVTLDRFSWTSLECWRYQSDWRAFNNYIYLPYCSHDPHRFKREQIQICELDGL